MSPLCWALSLALAQSGGTVRVPLDVFEAHQRAPAPARPPAFTFGEARYVGVADDASTLLLTLEVHVSLAGDGPKEVPLVGPGVVLRGASVDGEPVGVSQGPAGAVWRTERVGDVVLTVEGVVASTGPRGSTEYDFGVVPTPITTLDLTFPQAELRPRVDGAVTAQVTSDGASTRLRASLAKTDRVRLVGLRALGAEASSDSRLYATTSHLLAVDERELELFTVVRYDILYAPANRFEVFVPEGLRVVSADGEGAFTYTVVPAPGGSTVVGETATPMRSHYELSLELVREPAAGPVRFVLPAARGVERESGWVGIEAPGRVQLEPVAGLVSLASVPVAELPDELRSASVSPLLEGFRLQGEGAALELRAHVLPEVEARAERIDAITAHSVVSSNGHVQTELVLTLRNRLRPGLAVTLPPGATLVRAMRDGQVVTPSLAADGAIVVPLRRSGPDLPLTVQLLVEEDLGPFGGFSRATLSLPAVDWPAAQVAWDVSWPGRWSEPTLDLPDQHLAGYGHWLGAAAQGAPPTPPSQLVAASGATTSHHRYWVPAGESLTLRARRVPWVVSVAGRLAGVAVWLVALPLALGWLGWRAFALVRGLVTARRPAART